MSLVPREDFVNDTIFQVYVLQLYLAASMTVLYYEYFVTLLDEIRLVWSKRITFSAFLFLLNRYATLFGYIVTLYFTYFAPGDVTLCTRVVRIPGYLTIISQIVVTVLFSLRTYALYSRNKWILAVTLTFGCVVIVVLGVVLTLMHGSVVNLKILGISDIRSCFPGMLKTKWSIKAVFILTTVYDGLIFVLTLAKTIKLSLRTRSRLSRHIMRDGSMYFGTIVLANIINLVLFIKSPNSEYTQSTGNGSILSHVISATMISRLYLNLQEHVNNKVVIYDAHSISIRNRDIESFNMHPLTTWIVGVVDELDDKTVFDEGNMTNARPDVSHGSRLEATADNNEMNEPENL